MGDLAPVEVQASLNGRAARRAAFAFACLLAACTACRPVESPAPVEPVPETGVSFTRDPLPAHRFGTHEIVLEGSGDVRDPFGVEVRVRFSPPEGTRAPVVVDGFYDGGRTWRARVYVDAVGRWNWTVSSADPKLSGRRGAFDANEAPGGELPGLLGKDPSNPRAWRWADGRPFVHVSDTAYRLFHPEAAPMWRDFVRQSASRGTTSLRVACLGGWGGAPRAERDVPNYWVRNDPWEGGGAPVLKRFDLERFRIADERLVWIVNRYPRMALQLILFSLKGWNEDDTGIWWSRLPREARERTMRYMIARWSAFPQVFWLIVNDLHSDARFPANRAFIREVGRFFAAREPWPHLISTGPNRFAGFPFGAEDLDWCGYAHIEDGDSVGAAAIEAYGLDRLPLHVFLGEDFYEQDFSRYVDARFYFRWLWWSWLLSGGSANYCGRWGVIHPYEQASRPDLVWVGARGRAYTGQPLVGLDSAPFVASYFERRGIDLAGFVPDDARARDVGGREGKLRPQLARRGTEEFLVYHPHANRSGYDAAPDPTTSASFRIDLRDAPGRFDLEWYRPMDGTALRTLPVQGGVERVLTAPWPACDVVARLTRRTEDR